MIDESNNEDSPARQTANSGGEDCPPPEAMPNGSALGQRAREILVMRRKRYPIFGRAMFGEPAWDMLLLLYLSGATSAKMVSELADLAGASKSTGLRWVRYLEAQRLICRQSHATDKRAEVVTLSEKGVGAIEFYLHETLENCEPH